MLTKKQEELIRSLKGEYARDAFAKIAGTHAAVNREFITEALKVNPGMFRYIDPRLKDAETMKLAIKGYAENHGNIHDKDGWDEFATVIEQDKDSFLTLFSASTERTRQQMLDKYDAWVKWAEDDSDFAEFLMKLEAGRCFESQKFPEQYKTFDCLLKSNADDMKNDYWVGKFVEYFSKQHDASDSDFWSNFIIKTLSGSSLRAYHNEPDIESILIEFKLSGVYSHEAMIKFAEARDGALWYVDDYLRDHSTNAERLELLKAVADSDVFIDTNYAHSIHNTTRELSDEECADIVSKRPELLDCIDYTRRQRGERSFIDKVITGCSDDAIPELIEILKAEGSNGHQFRASDVSDYIYRLELASNSEFNEGRSVAETYSIIKDMSVSELFDFCEKSGHTDLFVLGLNREELEDLSDEQKLVVKDCCLKHPESISDISGMRDSLECCGLFYDEDIVLTLLHQNPKWVVDHAGIVATEGLQYDVDYDDAYTVTKWESEDDKLHDAVASVIKKHPEMADSLLATSSEFLQFMPDEIRGDADRLVKVWSDGADASGLLRWAADSVKSDSDFTLMMLQDGAKDIDALLWSECGPTNSHFSNELVNMYVSLRDPLSQHLNDDFKLPSEKRRQRILDKEFDRISKKTSFAKPIDYGTGVSEKAGIVAGFAAFGQSIKTAMSNLSSKFSKKVDNDIQDRLEVIEEKVETPESPEPVKPIESKPELTALQETKNRVEALLVTVKRGQHVDQTISDELQDMLKTINYAESCMGQFQSITEAFETYQRQQRDSFVEMMGNVEKLVALEQNGMNVERMSQTLSSVESHMRSWITAWEDQMGRAEEAVLMDIEATNMAGMMLRDSSGTAYQAFKDKVQAGVASPELKLDPSVGVRQIGQSLQGIANLDMGVPPEEAKSPQFASFVEKVSDTEKTDARTVTQTKDRQSVVESQLAMLDPNFVSGAQNDQNGHDGLS